MSKPLITENYIKIRKESIIEPVRQQTLSEIHTKILQALKQANLPEKILDEIINNLKENPNQYPNLSEYIDQKVSHLARKELTELEELTAKSKMVGDERIDGVNIYDLIFIRIKDRNGNLKENYYPKLILDRPLFGNYGYNEGISIPFPLEGTISPYFGEKILTEEFTPYGKKIGDSYQIYPLPSASHSIILKILSPEEIRKLMLTPDESKKNPSKVEYGDIVFLKNKLKDKVKLEKGNIYRLARDEFRYWDPLLWHIQNIPICDYFDLSSLEPKDRELDLLLNQRAVMEKTETEDYFSWYSEQDIFENKYVGDIIPHATYHSNFFADESEIINVMTPKTYKKRFLP